jgi:capsular exopolysaccharide synthesis family protein
LKSLSAILTNLITQPGNSPLPAGGAPEQWVRINDQLNNPFERNNQDINFAEIWRVLQRRKRLALVTASTVVGLAALITIHQRLFNPIYMGSFTLLISDPINSEDQQQVGGASGSGGLIEQVARNAANTDIPTLIELLKSPVLLDPIGARNPEASKSLANLKIESGGTRSNKAEGVLNISLTGSNPGNTQKLLNDLATIYLQTALIQRQQRLADGIQFLDRQAPALQQKSAELQQQLALFRQRHSVLEPTTEGAALKAKMLTQSDDLLNLQNQRSKLLNVRQAILNGTLTARSYQEAIAGLGGNSGGGGGASSSGDAGIGLSVVDANQSLLEQLTKLDAQLAEARAKFTPSSSMVVGLEARKQRLMPILRQSQLEAVAGALQSNQLSQAVARQQQAQLNTIFQGKPQLIKQYEVLQQKLTIANDNLASFLKAKENFQLEIAQKTVPWKVIAPVNVSGTPIKPSVPRNMALGLMLGLAAGVGAALLRDRLDHVFHNPGEAGNDLQQTLLGHIPHVEFFQGVREQSRFLIDELDNATKPQSPAAPNSSQASTATSSPASTPAALKIPGYQRFYYQEAFRNLFTSLRFLDSDRPLRAVALTSAVPNEGKSLVNVLLAKTLSEMGKRVLLIDADLRKPQLHHRLGLNNLVGLSNVLTEENMSWREALQEVKNYPGWYAITSGRRPPDPTRLLSSSRMRQLTQDITDSAQFDLVIYDTPPVLGLADAMLTSEHVDGLILLISLNNVDRDLPKEAIRRIQGSQCTLLGLVTNAVKTESAGSASYGYGKSKYGYGNGYGNGYGYGYGYGSYTQATYSYYNNDSDNSDSDNNNSISGPTGNASAENSSVLASWGKQVNRYGRKLVRWIDR